MSVRRLFTIGLSIVLIVSQLLPTAGRALAISPTAPNPAPSGPGSIASSSFPPWLPQDYKPVEPVPVPEREKQTQTTAVAPGGPGVAGIAGPGVAGTGGIPPAVAAVVPAWETRRLLQVPLGTGNSNYGQTQRDTDNPQNHPGHHFAGSVNLLNGNFFLTVGDFFFPGRGLSVQLARSYNSLAAANGEMGAFGRGWTHSYETQIIDAGGGLTLTVRTADGALHDYHSPQPCPDAPTAACYEAPPGLYRQLRAFPGGYELFYKNGTIQQFDALGRLAQIVDRNNNRIGLFYAPDCITPLSAAEALCQINDSSGQRGLRFQYDGSSGIPLLVSVQEWLPDGAGREITYQHVGEDLTGVTTPEGGEATYAYDVLHRMTSYADPRQPEGVRQADDIAYDLQNRVVTTTYAIDSFFDVYYAIDYEPPPRGLPAGFLSQPGQNPAGAVEISDGAGQLSRVEYDANGNITYEGDYFFDRGRWWGKWWWWWPGRWWLLQRKVDANLHPTAYDYDSWGNTTVITNALNAEQRFAWEEPFYEGLHATYGNVLSATNSLDVTTLYVYDTAIGQVTEIQAAGAPEQTATAYESDIWGQLRRQVDNAGQETTYAYDDFGNTTVITDARGGITRNAFDLVGRPVATTDQAGNETVYVYDASDRLLSVTDPEGGTTRYTYSADGRDNLVQLVNANGVTTTFDYDRLDRLITETNSLDQVTSYAYDNVSRLVRRTDADGRVTRYAYDAKSRMTGAAYYQSASSADPYLTNAYRYDGAGNLVGMANEDVRLAYTYDALDQRTQIDMWAPGWPTTQTLQLERDPQAGNLTGLSGPDGYNVTYAYDSLNRVTLVTDPGGRTASYSYDGAGRTQQTIHPQGIVVDYAYNETNHLVRVTQDLSGTASVSYTYDYDSRGYLTDEVDEGEVTTFTYDSVGRVITATGDAQGEIAFEYDAVGNRLSARNPEGDTRYDYDAHNRLTQAGDATFAYNEMGARTAAQFVGPTASGIGAPTGATQADAATILYSYDNDMRLTRLEAGTVYTYSYDPLGNLIGIVDGSGNARYLLRDGEDVYLELDGGGGIIAQYTLGPDRVLGMRRGNRDVLFLSDGRGRVRRVVDLDSGQVVTTYGPDLSDPGSGEALYNPIRINGAWWLPEVGLVLFGDGVFWDPWTGVFLIKAWPWLYWPFGPFHPWRPIFRFWPWPWPWARPWGWPWPRPWPFLWPWPGAWVRPWVIWPFWPWGLRPWWPWWYWRAWWGWTWWGHWWCWQPWWWWGKWWWWPWWHPWWWWGYWWFPWWWWWSCWWWPWHWWWWHWWWWPWWWGGWNWWCWWWWWPWWWCYWPWWWPPTLGPPEVGDAPDPPYPSTRRNGGATHGIWWYEWLGAGRDGEWDSKQVDADRFDDGVAVDLRAGTLVFTPTVSAPLSGRYGPRGRLNVHGWADWNGDGDWDDPGELIVDWSGYPGDGSWPSGQNSFTVSGPFPTPGTLLFSDFVTDLWLRFRLDYNHNLTSPRGYTRFGEVEDHRLRLTRPQRPIWADRLRVSPLASLVLTYTRVVTGVGVSITPTVLITPLWRTVAGVPLARLTNAGESGNELTIEHEPFTAGQRYTVSLSSGSVVTGTGTVLIGGEIVLPASFSFVADWATRLYLPVGFKDD